MKRAASITAVFLLSVSLLAAQRRPGSAPLGPPRLGANAPVGFGQGSFLEAAQAAARIRRAIGRRPRRWRPRRRGRICPLPYYYSAWIDGIGQPEPVELSIEKQSSPEDAVLINRDFKPEKPTPVVRDYSAGDLPEPVGTSPSFPAVVPASTEAQGASPADSKKVIYLIALKNQTIYPATRLWIQGRWLGFIDTRGVEKQVPLSRVDKDFTNRLNRERNLPVLFELP